MIYNSLVFFGGCTGIGKTDLLNEALEQFDSKEYHIINIADHFNKCHRGSSGDESYIIWHGEHWKKYEPRVLASLRKEISECGKSIVIINQHFATISPFGYLPGVDLDTLDSLLEQQIKLAKSNNVSESGSKKGNNKTNVSDDSQCSFGVLLIDTAPNVMRHSYTKQLGNGDKSILGYVSNESILKDLEENRKWAGIYASRALATLDRQNVYNDTVYIYEPTEKDQAIKEIVEFLEKFGLSKA